MNILDYYIRRSVLVATGLVSVIIIGLETFLTLMQQFHDAGVKGYGLWQAFLFVPMQLPAQFYQLFPMAGFLGALIGLGGLSASSQLAVMRASGVSVNRILWSVLKAAILMVVVMTIIGEGVGPWWQQKAAIMKQKILFPASDGSLLQSIWLHQGNNFVHIGAVVNKDTLQDITRYQFSTQGDLQAASFAKTAQRINGMWQLEDIKTTFFSQQGVTAVTQATANMPVIFHPKLQIEMNVVSGEQSLVNLYHTISYRKLIGLDNSTFLFSLWQRILQPITTLVMIGLAVPFVLGSFRSTSMGMRVITGVLVGFIFYMLSQLFGPITMVYQFPPFYAAVIPTGLFFAVGMILLAKLQ